MAIDRLRAYLMHKHLQAEQCDVRAKRRVWVHHRVPRTDFYQVPPANSSGGDGEDLRG